jgi:Ca-activated chloride channel homolog
MRHTSGPRAAGSGYARPRRGALRLRAAALLVAGVLAAVTGCTSSGGSHPSHPDSAAAPAAKYHKGTLRILASSELADMKGILDEARQKTGVKVETTYSGTLDAAKLVASGQAAGKYDAIWLSNNDYLHLQPGATSKLTNETPIMSSPVAIGVKTATVDELGWKPDSVTWSDVYDAVRSGKLTYGMTDPVRSNSGYSALISVASALSDAQSALTQADVDKTSDKMKAFFTGQKLTSGSSGWLATAYAHSGTVNALVNYESVLEELNRDNHTGFTVIRPLDGVVTANYPFTLLTSAPQGARQSADALTSYLKSPAVQKEITQKTFRRPVLPQVAPAAALDGGRRRELPFPGSLSVANGLLDSYENKLRRPSRTVYVLDTSGSMAGSRLAELKSALDNLTQPSGPGAAGESFRDREQVTLMPFGDQVKKVTTHTVDPDDPDLSLAAIHSDVKKLTASGNTAVYDSLKAAYAQLGRSDSDTFTSIVLMTDGASNVGSSASQFGAFYAGLPKDQRATPVFPIVFGDSDRSQLQHIADVTGGQLFDATSGGGALDGAFEEIRGYQ